ncbi:SRPBCC family protein [Pseudoalteromonas xiamenensis]
MRHLFIALLCLISWSSKAIDWSTWYQSDNLTIQKRLAQTGVVEVKVWMQVAAAKKDNLLSVLADVDNAKSWLPHVEQVTLVSRPTPAQSIVYTLFDAPFPLAKRQLFTRSCLSIESVDSRLVYQMQVHDIANSSLPDDIVTVTPMRAQWRFYETVDGLVIEYNALAHPNGRVPLWLVNRNTLASTKTAFQALASLMLKPKYQHYAHGFEPGDCSTFANLE